MSNPKTPTQERPQTQESGASTDPAAQTPPESPAPEDKAVAASLKASYILFGSLFAAILLNFLPLPLSLFAPLCAVFALVWIVRYLILSIRAKRARTAILNSVIAFVVAGYIVMAGAMQLFLLPIETAYQECSGQALTEQAKALCQQDRHNDTNEWFKSVTGQDLPGRN